MKAKVALVDDDRNVLTSVSEALENEGYTVTTYSDGEEALAGMAADPVDVAVLDIKMPKMDGIEACEKIKNLDNYNNCTIIFLSARNEEFTQIAAYDAGAHDFINKPVKPRILIKKTEAIVKKSIPEKSTSKNGIFINTSK